MTSPEKGHLPDNQNLLDVVNSTASLSQSHSVSEGVQNHVTGLLRYMDDYWVEMTGERWKLEVIDILQALRENPRSYSGLIIRYKIGESQEIRENPEVMFSAVGGVDHAAGAIMAELRKIRDFNSEDDIILIAIKTL